MAGNRVRAEPEIPQRQGRGRREELQVQTDRSEKVEPAERTSAGHAQNAIKKTGLTRFIINVLSLRQLQDST